MNIIAYAIHISLTPQNGALIAGLSSGASCIGRVILGLAADHMPKTVIVSLCAWGAAGSVLIIWTLSKSFGTYLLFALVYGLLTGGFYSLVPLVLSETFGPSQLSTVIGFLYAISGIGVLAGAPTAGILLEASKPDVTYTPVILAAGGALVIGAMCVSTWVIFRRREELKKSKGETMTKIDSLKGRPFKTINITDRHAHALNATYRDMEA